MGPASANTVSDDYFVCSFMIGVILSRLWCPMDHSYNSFSLFSFSDFWQVIVRFQYCHIIILYSNLPLTNTYQSSWMDVSRIAAVLVVELGYRFIGSVHRQHGRNNFHH